MGKVYLVGAGPGDPELITVKGARVLERADVVIYDRLINPKILEFAKNAKELVYLGKWHGQSEKQEEINKMLVEKARRHDVVVRLKGGDPFVFGRGGEECEILRRAGIEYEIVPGITSAIAGPAYAGIPVTHRNYASSLAIVTGHKKEDSALDLQDIFRAVDTVSILMGVSNLEDIVRQALEAGLPPETPIVAIENATRENQRVIKGTLSDFPEKARKENLRPPAVIVVGKVCNLHEKLRWI